MVSVKLGRQTYEDVKSVSLNTVDGGIATFMLVEPIPEPKVEIVPWDSGTDEQIAAMVAALDAGTLSIEDTGWSIGDQRDVSLSAMATTFAEANVAQTATLVLMDSQHYDLTEATPGGDTKDHFVVGVMHGLKRDSSNNKSKMHSSMTNSGSWKYCDRRTWCNDVFRMAIPEALRGCFKQFKVVTATEYNGNTVTRTDDYFALFAEKEVLGSHNKSSTVEADALSQIKWYEHESHRIKKEGNDGSSDSWFTRSPADDSNTYCIFFGNGNANSAYANGYCLISPFGCI